VGFMIRDMLAQAKLSDEHVLKSFEHIVPKQVVRHVIEEHNATEKRCRKLPAELTLLLTVGMGLFPHDALNRVLYKLVKGLRYIWPGSGFDPATGSAICQARYNLGARPVVGLFRRVCKPLASPDTPGAFLFGLRLMAIDSTGEDVPDTEANSAAFGRHSNQHGDANFPQIMCVYLSECGTHAIVDAGLWPCHTGEDKGARRMLRSIEPGMLVMWDKGLHSFALVEQVLHRGAQVLGRLPSDVKVKKLERLVDGSYLAELSYGKGYDRKRERSMQVRLLEYALDDPNRVGHGENHRLITTLLDPQEAPSLDLICAYHERWEIELTIDEIDSHLRQLERPLRSHKPVGIIQELYGLLIAHYIVRAVMHEAAVEIGEDPRRLSFVNSVQILADAIDEFQKVLPEQKDALYRRLLRDIQRNRLPERVNRISPRVVKRTRKKYPPKRPNHRTVRTVPFRQAVVLA
jgi:hypothetical protein